MALVGRRDGRNFGYGRQLSYTGPQALKDMFGGGDYGTVKAHCDRWQAFVKWCRFEQVPGINNARQIDRKVLTDYAAYLREVVGRGDLAVSTAQNRLSSVSRTMATFRGDQCVKLPSPSKALGMQRTGVRHSVPQGQDREQVKQIVNALCSHHRLRTAAILMLARATGMRLREAILADLSRLSREANDQGRINIQDGTKGGRSGASAPRWIAVDDHVRVALEFARQVSPAGSRNLIAPHESYLNLLQEIIRPARAILHAHNLKGFHELRAAYACERFEQLTRHHAPVNGEVCHRLDCRLDHEAREQISHELGHGRIDVLAAYIGGAEMSKPFDMDLFLAGALTWSHATRQRHLRQAKVIQTAIAQRWHLKTPWDWQRKHVNWFLKHHLNRHSEAAQYYSAHNTAADSQAQKTLSVRKIAPPYE